jgi:hypothetical protein
MIRNQREHVVLDVVIHVPVKVSVDAIHVDRSTIQPMVEDILRHPCVLGESIDQAEPGAKEIGKAHKEQRQNAVGCDRERDHE